MVDTPKLFVDARPADERDVPLVVDWLRKQGASVVEGREFTVVVVEVR